MKKPKKITIKFFLNKYLRPIPVSGELCYPLYAQITYNRKNTQIKSCYGEYYASYEKMKTENSELLAFEDKIIRNAVTYEINKNSEDFNLLGLGDKYEIFATGIHQILNIYLKMKLKEHLQRDSEPKEFLAVLNFDKQYVDFELLYEAGKRLFNVFESTIEEGFLKEIEVYRAYCKLYQKILKNKELNFPVVIEWLDGTHLHEITQKFINLYQNDTQKVEFAMQLIDRVVNTKLIF